jgi:hypothetical protein
LEFSLSRTLLTKTYRLSIYAGARWGELYELAEDPDECVNLWDDPGLAATKSELLSELARRMLDHIETSPYPDYIA